MTQDRTATPVSRDQILRRERGQGKIYTPCSVDHGQDWQPYTADSYSAVSHDHTYRQERANVPQGSSSNGYYLIH